MRTRLVLAAVLMLMVAACGGDDTTAEETTTSTTAAAATTTSAAPAVAGVSLAETSLGEILVGPEGMTLYGFTVDDPGVSNCYDGCAQAWPPLAGDTPIGEGLDASLFSTTERTDGTTQLVIGDWPLYYFAGDAQPGDVNGQDVEGVWFVVDAAGQLIGVPDDTATDDSEAPTAIHVAETELGPTLVDADGMTLYGFTPDTPTASSCTGGCAENWPPVPGDAELSPDLDAASFTTITRDDGTTQLVFGDWPLYRFVGDSRPGDIAGQGVNDVWFVIGPDATLYR